MLQSPKSSTLKPAFNLEGGTSPIGKRGASPFGARRLERSLALDGADPSTMDVDSLRSLTPSPASDSSARTRKKSGSIGAMLQKMKADLDHEAILKEVADSRKLNKRVSIGDEASSSPTSLETVPEIPSKQSTTPESNKSKNYISSIVHSVKHKLGSRSSSKDEDHTLGPQSSKDDVTLQGTPISENEDTTESGPHRSTLQDENTKSGLRSPKDHDSMGSRRSKDDNTMQGSQTSKDEDGASLGSRGSKDEDTKLGSRNSKNEELVPRSSSSTNKDSLQGSLKSADDESLQGSGSWEDKDSLHGSHISTDELYMLGSRSSKDKDSMRGSHSSKCEKYIGGSCSSQDGELVMDPHSSKDNDSIQDENSLKQEEPLQRSPSSKDKGITIEARSPKDIRTMLMARFSSDKYAYKMGPRSSQDKDTIKGGSHGSTNQTALPKSRGSKDEGSVLESRGPTLRDTPLESHSSRDQDTLLESRSSKNEDAMLESRSSQDKDSVLESRGPRIHDIIMKSHSSKDQDTPLESRSPKNQDSMLESHSSQDQNTMMDSRSNTPQDTTLESRNPSSQDAPLKSSRSSKDQDVMLMSRSSKGDAMLKSRNSKAQDVMLKARSPKEQDAVTSRGSKDHDTMSKPRSSKDPDAVSKSRDSKDPDALLKSRISKNKGSVFEDLKAHLEQRQGRNIRKNNRGGEAEKQDTTTSGQFDEELISKTSSNSSATHSSSVHLGDLEAEPKLVSSVSPTELGSSQKKMRVQDSPTTDDNPEETIPPEQTILQVLSPQDPTICLEEDESNKMESTSPPPADSPLINYGATAQRMRIKKTNLQRETLQRIFRQRRESEGEVDPTTVESTAANGTPKETESLPSYPEHKLVIRVPSDETTEPDHVKLPATSVETTQPLAGSSVDDEDDIDIIREYLQPTQVSTVTVSVHPQPDDQSAYRKRLSIITEGESDQSGGGPTYLNPEIEYSTIRRASDFTDSFRKLEPFKFDVPALIEGKRERLYKVLVVGELGTGKTSIIKRYVHQFFSQHYRATIGVDFALKVLRWDPETVVRLQLWDIAGQERFGSMTRVYYKEAVGAFVVFDVSRSATLDAVPKWKADLDSKVVLPDGCTIPAVLLANKSDQPKEGIAANREKMNEFCQQQGFSAWFETSAKENANIDEAANFLVSKILEMDKWSQEPVATDPDRVGLRLGNGGKSQNNSCSC